MDHGGSPATTPGDAGGPVEERLPPWHPDAPRRRRLWWLRKRKPITVRHFNLLLETIREDRRKHEREFQELFARIGDSEDVLATVRERPEALILGEVLAGLEQLELRLRRHYAERDAQLDALASQLRDLARALADAFREMAEDAQRLLEESESD